MKNKGNEIIINVTNEDTNLLNASKVFLSSLEEEYTKFKQNLITNENSNKKYQKNKNFFFCPEQLSKKSPLTILNAPWGTGKTYFIENILKLMIDKELESNIFTKMLIIDAWKFSNSKDVPIEFIEELGKSLIGLNNGTIESKIGNKKIIKKLVDKLAPSSINLGYQDFYFEYNFQNKNNLDVTPDQTTEIDKIWKNIENNEEPTIIFIDNLERLGSLSWDLLKTVIKFQEFKNFLIVLPLNINKIKNNDKIDISEYPIEKYIDIAMFNYKQDYFGYLKQKTSQNIADKINKIFLEEIDGEKLSIREVDQSIRKNNLFEKKKFYEMIKIIYKNIWSAKETIEKILMDDVTKFLEFKQLEINLLKEIYNKCIIEKKDGTFLNFKTTFEQKENGIIAWDTKQNYYFEWEKKYTKDIKYLFDLISENANYLKNELELTNQSIKKLEKAIDKSNKGIIKQNNDISEWTKRKDQELNKEANEKDSEIITNMEKNIMHSKDTIKNEEDKISQWKSDIKNLSLDSNKLETNIDSLFDIGSCYQAYISANNKTKSLFGANQNKYILKYLQSIKGSNLLFYDGKNSELIDKIRQKIIEIIL